MFLQSFVDAGLQGWRVDQNFRWVDHNALGPANNFQLLWPFVSCSFVKLVKKQICVAMTAFCGFKVPADQIFADVSKS